MQSSPFFSRCSIVIVVFLPLLVSSQSIPGATFFTGSGAPEAAEYRLVDDYESLNFFNKFNFYSASGKAPPSRHEALLSVSSPTILLMVTCSEYVSITDMAPMLMWIRYVNESVAIQNGFVQTTARGTALIKPDTTNKWPNGGPGRPSVRIISDNTYTHGLFILDLVHMPYGCGTWPAYWLLGPHWPFNGEIDIIEGVNTIMSNSISMHTSPGCAITGSGETGNFQTQDCNEAVNGNSGCGTQLNNTETPNNYGDSLNSIGGGVYATEWTSNYVKTWFFPRSAIPTSIASGQPNVSAFGEPAVNAQGSCNIDAHFNNMSIIINIDFCGAWAGWVYQSQYPNCPQNMSANSLDSCVDFVGNNPLQMTNAYWEINSIKVYQMPPNIATTSTYSTSLSTISPSASTNTVGLGMGASTSVSSSAYTGPLSSVTTSTTDSTPSSAPAICPGHNQSVWNDYSGEQYQIGCGYDYNGNSGGLGVYQVISFEACLEKCDGLNGCRAASFVGGDGAGNCFPKAAVGEFNYDGTTNAGVRVAGPVSISSTSVFNSSGSQTTSSVSSAASLPTSTTAAICQNDTQVTDPAGYVYLEYCALDTNGAGAYATQIFQSGDFTQCRSLCDASSGCGAFVWSPYGDSGGACYLKHLPQAPGAAARSGQVAGILVSSGAKGSYFETSPTGASSSVGVFFSPVGSIASSSLLQQSSSASTMTVSSLALPEPSSSAQVALQQTTTSGSSGMSTSTASITSPLPDCGVSNTSSALANSACQEPHIAPSGPNGTISQSVSTTGASEQVQNESIGNPDSHPTLTHGDSSTSASLGNTITMSNSAPACPTETVSLCARPDQQSTCLDLNGATYRISCGIEYKGSIIDTQGLMKTKRAIQPDFRACQDLCDSTNGCVAINYMGSNCTMYSSLSGQISTPGAVGASQISPPTISAATSNLLCPQSAGSMYTDSRGTVYSMGCYTDFGGNDIGAPINEPSFRACLPYCDSLSACIGVEFNTAYNLCYLKSSFTGLQTSNTSIIYGMKQRAALSPEVVGSAGGATVTPTLSSTQSLPSGATVTVIPITTVISTASLGGIYSSGPSGTSTNGSVALVSASLCFTCALTPSLVTAGGFGSSSGGISPVGSSYWNTCKAQPGIGTTTVFSTRTITSCGQQPTCPASGYIIFGGGAIQSGAIAVTTTDDLGSAIVYTQVPTTSAIKTSSGIQSSGNVTLGSGGGSDGSSAGQHGGSGGAGGAASVITANGGQGGTTTFTVSGSTIITTGSKAVPTCPYSQGQLFTDSMGMQYYIECNILFSDETIDTQTQSNLASCIAACDMYNTMTFFTASKCLGVSYYSVQISDNCLLKSGFTGIFQEGVNSAQLMTPYIGPGRNMTSDSTGGSPPYRGLASTTYGTMMGPSATTYNPGGMSGGSGGSGSSGSREGAGPGQTIVTSVVGGSTFLSTYETVAAATTVPEVSTYVSDGQNYISTYGYSVIPGSTLYGTATLVAGGSTIYVTRTVTTSTVSTTTTTVISRVPTTIYGTRTEVSTYVTNGYTTVSTYGVSTALSIVYVLTTAFSVSVSVSISNNVQTTTGPGATVTAPPQYITVTEGGGQAVTITAPASTVVSYVYPRSSSSSFTCRTYATNYLNGQHGKVKRDRRRSIFDVDAVLGEMGKAPQPAARPAPWFLVP